jgi:predicted  nucleic acid-binding Zn-ribbon protein
MSQAQVLYDLQQIDNEIRAKKHRLGEVLRLQKEPAELLAARESARAATADLQTWRSRHNNLTLEIASVKDKSKRSEDRLYSGVVKVPKELADLEKEVVALGHRREKLEMDELEMMETLEKRQADQAAAEAVLGKKVADFETSVTALKQEQQVLAIQLNKLLEKRERQVALAQPALLKTYDQLSRQKNGVAVAGLRLNKCLGCQLTLSAYIIKDAGEGKLVRCEHCDRILCPL